eukprot:COSAG05_NODE_3385_length_2095_cov_1.198898_1_plen_265_part_00
MRYRGPFITLTAYHIDRHTPTAMAQGETATVKGVGRVKGTAQERADGRYAVVCDWRSGEAIEQDRQGAAARAAARRRELTTTGAAVSASAGVAAVRHLHKHKQAAAHHTAGTSGSSRNTGDSDSVHRGEGVRSSGSDDGDEELQQIDLETGGAAAPSRGTAAAKPGSGTAAAWGTGAAMLSSRITETIEESQIKIDLTHINVPKGCVDGGVGVCQIALIYSTHPIEVFAFIDDGVGNYMIETMGLDTILQAELCAHRWKYTHRP